MALLCAAAKLAVDAAILRLVNQHAPDSYMDEPFHVGQTQQYCAGRYHVWDPKITTLPGLYVLGTAWARLLETAPQLTQSLGVDPCNTSGLRFINVILAAACLPLIHAIIKQQNRQMLQQMQQQEGQQHYAMSAAAGQRQHQSAKQPDAGEAKQHQILGSQKASKGTQQAPALLWAAVLCCMPLHWFYTYLYYTDVGSTFFLLLCYHQAHADRYLAAGLAGAMAVFFRQTNAVWVAFTLGAVLLRLAASTPVHTITKPADDEPVSGTRTGDSPQLLPKRDGRADGQHQGVHAAGMDSLSLPASAASGQGLIAELQQVLRGLWHAKARLAWLLPLAVVPAAFVAFLVINKGVAVGDREAHTPVVHTAQLAYFAVFSAAMLAPLLASQLPDAVQGMARAPVVTALALSVSVGLCIAVVRSAPAPHPYLLADNRHYTFYLWRKVLARNGGAYRSCVVGPAAGVAAALLASRLLRCQPRLWLLGYLVCLAAVLVPAWLLEFRYFTAGLLILALNVPRPSTPAAVMTLLMYTAINAVTLYLFLLRPFSWNDGSTARFMW